MYSSWFMGSWKKLSSYINFFFLLFFLSFGIGFHSVSSFFFYSSCICLTAALKTGLWRTKNWVWPSWTFRGKRLDWSIEAPNLLKSNSSFSSLITPRSSNFYSLLICIIDWSIKANDFCSSLKPGEPWKRGEIPDSSRAERSSRKFCFSSCIVCRLLFESYDGFRRSVLSCS